VEISSNYNAQKENNDGHTGPGFWAAWARAGGESRIQALIILARFDANGDGQLSDQELADFQKLGSELVNSAVSSFANFTVVFTLIIGSTHQNTISRPHQWSASPGFVDDFGSDAGDVTLWVVYGLNWLVEVLSLITLLCCIFQRFLFTNAITTLHTKICVLVSSNAVGNIAFLGSSALMLLCCLITAGGILGQGLRGKEGLLASVSLPVMIYFCSRLVSKWYVEVLNFQLEEIAALALSAKAAQTGGASSRIPPHDDKAIVSLA